MSNPVGDEARVIPLRPERVIPSRPDRTVSLRPAPDRAVPLRPAPARPDVPEAASGAGEPLWRDLVGEVLRRERRAQERTLKDVADAARISLPYLSEVERGRKEASSEVLAAAARALGLGLGDLLSLAHGELARRTAAPQRSATAPRRPYQGLCLAA
ncbi:helix-turn-helix domain-containing protein [Streptomyces actinomycinicus]|uniref:Helix-turn-helix domain-containing protein n=1 Tax=Streptomyces actinomycinicus TaxID=1695166 RepID=A0A937JRL3_9ACTN|nr:helix-turn-helix transcriptional regulator [Streptomyces actinomycinicus]MBL1084643.1 helix-turn-helix domain-containing protein [Streptomyces actinomycinicus]